MPPPYKGDVCKKLSLIFFLLLAAPATPTKPVASGSEDEDVVIRPAHVMMGGWRNGKPSNG
jgi:hypothetical protein